MKQSLTYNISEEDLYELANILMEKIQAKQTAPEQQFITKEQLKKILNLSSDTSVQRIRDENLIEFTQVGKRKYLYRLSSVMEYLNKNVVTY